MRNLKINKQRLNRLCQKYHIQLLILHGSFAQGHPRDQSDIDIGILGRKKFDLKTQLNMINEFSEVFGSQFDPVFLNGAEPLITYQVAVNGKALYEEKKGNFQRFRIQAVARYMDSKKFRQMEKLYIKKALGKIQP
ncbi:nucleotidyltransferase domain-containing protein [bacterium]|nr:nucleotidyltransferase domain-containing protein [bacterium]